MIEIRVVRKPVNIECDCPSCKELIYINYFDFIGQVGDPCDWKHETFQCPHCSFTIEIGSVDWD
jgi:hypothetical protein